MRLSTALTYTFGVDGIAKAQEALLRTQQQIATGRRVSTPADDPVAAAQALAIDQAKGRVGQYTTNIGAAKDSLAMHESVLEQITSLLQDVRTLAVNAGNGTLANSDRSAIGTDVAGRLQQLIGLANSKDGDGSYMYGGFETAGQPFVATPTGVAYTGDQGQRALEVAPARSLAITENGAALFQQIRNGNGSFAASAATTNAGTGVIGAGQVADPAAMTGHHYELQFGVAAGVTTYSVFDVTAGATVSAGNAYNPGTAITVAGMQTTISGAPAAGDRFALVPSTASSVFATLANLVTALQTPATGSGGSARVANDVAASLSDIDQALDHMLTVRADVGARLRELDSLASGNDDRQLRYDQTLSSLRDLDYNRALSEFAKQQLALQAAQQSFAKIAGLSLFDYLK